MGVHIENAAIRRDVIDDPDMAVDVIDRRAGRMAPGWIFGE
jgi:hypothetical protein